MASKNQIEQWKSLRDEMLNDTVFVERIRDNEQQRRLAITQMQDLLTRYLSNRISNEEFRNEFQHQTATEWKRLGLSGFSGAMFLNMLIKNIPFQDEITAYLKATLPAPHSVEEAHQLLHAFMGFLQDSIQSGAVTKQRIQPAHTPFFFSAWWHIQSPEQWPIYYIKSRKILESTDVHTPQNNPITDYFSFRETFDWLAQELGLSLWEMENLCVWYEENHSATVPATYEAENNELAPLADDYQDESTHTRTQYNLARLGQKLGCKIWIASNDRNKTWAGHRLGDFSIDSLPSYLGVDHQVQRTIELIDVLWLKGTHQIVAAFEVEHSTSIYSGLLRMSDLVALSPNISFPLYIVTSETRLKDVRKQLSRPTFQTLEIHNRCGFFSYEQLEQEIDHIMRWGRQPTVIDDLAEYVSDVEN